MTHLGRDYPEVRDLISLFSRMHERLSSRSRAEHCRTAAISIYDLEDHWQRGARLLSDRGDLVELHIRVSTQPVKLRKSYAHLLVLAWRENGFVEIFNGPKPKPWIEGENSTISIASLSLIDVPVDQRLLSLGPDTPRAYLGNEPTNLMNRQDGAGDGNGNDGGGAGGADAGDGVPGSGGVREVVGHPVLFSADPDAYRRLLEAY